MPERVLRVFADVADTRTVALVTAIDHRTFRWLPQSYVDLFRGESGRRGTGHDSDGFPDDRLTKRILATARLHDDPSALRVGWLWVIGRHDGATVFFPLASVAAEVPTLHGAKRLASSLIVAGNRYADVVATTEPELTDLIVDRDERRRLQEIPLGPRRYRSNDTSDGARSGPTPSIAEHRRTIESWAKSAALAAGFRAHQVRSVDTPLGDLRISPVGIVAAVGLYVAPPDDAGPRRITTSGALLEWADQSVDGTAFAHVYGDDGAAADDPAAAGPSSREPIVTSLRLDPSQRSVIESSVDRPLVVVSGPPGTGKSQTVVATAHHHVRLGRSVLIAAPTDASVAALVELMESSPGPQPIVFGNSTHRLEIANRLAEGGGEWFTSRQVADRQEALAAAGVERHRLASSLASLLASEAAASGDPTSLLLARQDAPGFFDVDADLRELDRLRLAASARGGWFARRRARHAADQLADAARSIEHLSVERLSELLDVAIARRRATTLELDGGLDLSDAWPGLISADDELRRAAGLALEAVTHHDDRADRSSRRAINAVAGALRAGRLRRRDLLANVRGDQLLEALPLWVATVRDVDDLLPMTPGLFDVVIIDEASHLDQIGAAPALLRARSAVVVGDPRQLRHVSFVSDDRMSAALEQQGLGATATANQLDLRRQSAFDAAAAVASVTQLAEHYRSAPHLIDFSARHFYDGRISVATRHPANERDDRISVIEVADGSRDTDGVNEAEIDVILDRLASHLESEAGEAGSVGVISPFRAQADAIEAAVIERLDLAEIDALDLRVGTVHSFQGCQRDVVYLSLAIDDDAPAGSRSFMSEATLFNVMVTRAKEQVVVVTSASRPDRGVLADYLRHADQPSLSRPDSRPVSGWTRRVADDLTAAGLRVGVGYAAGRHTVDLVIGDGDEAVGLSCGVHPDGPDAHIDRHLSLVRRGWTVLEAFESRWGDRTAELAIELGERSARTSDP